MSFYQQANYSIFLSDRCLTTIEKQKEGVDRTSMNKKKIWAISILVVIGVSYWVFSQYRLVPKNLWNEAKDWNDSSLLLAEKDNEIANLNEELEKALEERDKLDKQYKEEIEELHASIDQLQQEPPAQPVTTTQNPSGTDSQNMENPSTADPNVIPSFLEDEEEKIDFAATGLYAPALKGQYGLSDDARLYAVSISIFNESKTSLNLRAHHFELLNADGEKIGSINENAMMEFKKRMDTVPIYSGIIMPNSRYEGTLFYTISEDETPSEIYWENDENVYKTNLIN